MTANDVAKWMERQVLEKISLYQDDVVNHIEKAKAASLLRENSEGNMVLGTAVLNAFKKLTPTNVVWVRSERYWRKRVSTDMPGRMAED